jgi:hypothetical protein
MHAVRNYVNDRYRHEHAAKRHPGEHRLGALDTSQPVADSAPGAETPEQAFHRAWIRRLIEEAADRLRVEQLNAGRDWTWDIFESRVLLPMMNGQTPPPYEVLMTRWNLTTHAQVANAIVRMRHAFVKHLLSAVGSTVDSPEEARLELRRLLLTFDRSSS